MTFRIGGAERMKYVESSWFRNTTLLYICDFPKNMGVFPSKAMPPSQKTSSAATTPSQKVSSCLRQLSKNSPFRRQKHATNTAKKNKHNACSLSLREETEAT